MEKNKKNNKDFERRTFNIQAETRAEEKGGKKLGLEILENILLLMRLKMF